MIEKSANKPQKSRSQKPGTQKKAAPSRKDGPATAKKKTSPQTKAPTSKPKATASSKTSSTPYAKKTRAPKAAKPSPASKHKPVSVKVEESAAIKKRLLEAFLDLAEKEGWTKETLFKACTQVGEDEAMVWALFPKREEDALKTWNRALDEAMVEKLKTLDLEAMKVRERVFWAVRVRLQLLVRHKQAARKAFYYLCIPAHLNLTPRLVYETVHLMWVMAGDQSSDHNFYTKRLLLAGVYVSTFLYWLKDTSPEHHETWKFLEKRIENVLLIQKAKNLQALFDPKMLSENLSPVVQMVKHFWPFK